MNQLLTVADVAAILQASASAVYKLVEYGDLGDYCHRLGITGKGKILFHEQDLEVWLETRKGRPVARDVKQLEYQERKNGNRNIWYAGAVKPQRGCGREVEADSNGGGLIACKRTEPKLRRDSNRLRRISIIKETFASQGFTLPANKFQNQLISANGRFGGELCLN